MMAGMGGRQLARRWQGPEAKQRLSEVLRKARDEGPQIITRHGEDVAVVIDMSEYRHMAGKEMSFHDYLLSGPTFPDDFDELVERDRDHGRDVSFLLEE